MILYLLEFVRLTPEQGMGAAEDHSKKVLLYQQVDTVFDGYSGQMDSLKE